MGVVEQVMLLRGIRAAIFPELTFFGHKVVLMCLRLQLFQKPVVGTKPWTLGFSTV